MSTYLKLDIYNQNIAFVIDQWEHLSDEPLMVEHFSDFKNA